MANLDNLTRRVLRFRQDRQWGQFHNPKDVALSLCLEAAEVAELMQWQEGAALAETLRKRRDELAAELSDVLYWTLLLAHDQGIDLAEAFERKMQENERKYPVEKARGSAKKYTEL